MVKSLSDSNFFKKNNRKFIKQKINTILVINHNMVKKFIMILELLSEHTIFFKK